SSQLSHFPNSNNDHCDLGFIVIACDVVRRPSRGHEVSMEDLRSKGGERLGLAVEEGERLGLWLVLSIFNCTAVSRGVPS
ncbi:MAG: hypothetical protein ACK559_37820, partial [bacterium]